eukprot:s353_g3.t1
MDLVNSLGADLLSQLEVVFSSDESGGDLGSAVMTVVERWRGQLPLRHEASAPSDMYMEHMGAACEDAVKAVTAATDESDVNARRAFLAAYRERMASVPVLLRGDSVEHNNAPRRSRLQKRLPLRPHVCHANRYVPAHGIRAGTQPARHLIPSTCGMVTSRPGGHWRRISRQSRKAGPAIAATGVLALCAAYGVSSQATGMMEIGFGELSQNSQTLQVG